MLKLFAVILFTCKTIIRFGFCDIQNNQGLGKCYQPQPPASLITVTSTLIIPDIAKTSSNNCLLSDRLLSLLNLNFRAGYKSPGCVTALWTMQKKKNQ